MEESRGVLTKTLSVPPLGTSYKRRQMALAANDSESHTYKLVDCC